ncbi:MAG: hypothetical protein R6U25_07335, partial [Alkalispirochaeta sp.]
RLPCFFPALILQGGQFVCVFQLSFMKMCTVSRRDLVERLLTVPGVGIWCDRRWWGGCFVPPSAGGVGITMSSRRGSADE